MPPPGYEPFLRAICENPADDTVRLVYADWLDENGDPERAEFIRASIAFELAAKQPGLQATLLPRYQAACQPSERWKAELPKLPGINWPGAFRRGFPYEVATSDGRWLLRHQEAVFSAAPIECLSLANAGLGTLSRVLQLEELTRISTLWLNDCRVEAGQWSVLAECPYLGSLTRLVISPSWRRAAYPVVEPDDARVLSASAVLPRGLELRLFGWVSVESFDVLRARFANVTAYRVAPTPPPGSPSP